MGSMHTSDIDAKKNLMAGLAYDLDQFSIVAIPDFLGAMENKGLVRISCSSGPVVSLIPVSGFWRLNTCNLHTSNVEKVRRYGIITHDTYHSFWAYMHNLPPCRCQTCPARVPQS